MNSIKLYLPFFLAFFFIAIPLKVFDQKPGDIGMQVEFPPPPHLEPNAIQSQNSNQINHLPINALNPLASNDVITNVLGLGDNQIHGLIYYNGSLWASTRTNPARILRINPSTLALENRITLASGQDDTEDITAGQGYVWTITYTNPAQLIRIDPGTNTAQTAIPFQSSELSFGISLKYAFGYLWAGGLNHLARIDISNPLTPTHLIYDYSSIATDGYVLISALTSSNDRLWGILEQYSLAQSKFIASTIIKINPVTPTVGYVTNTVSTLLFPDDITYAGTHFFASSENQPVQTSPSYMYAFDDNPTTFTSKKVSDSASYGTSSNPKIPASFWGAYVASPGKLLKFDLNSNLMITLTLPFGFNDPSEIAFDEIGNMYVTTWQSPSGIVKYSVHLINIPIVMKNKSP